jgi:hypothetical protein
VGLEKSSVLWGWSPMVSKCQQTCPGKWSCDIWCLFPLGPAGLPTLWNFDQIFILWSLQPLYRVAKLQETPKNQQLASKAKFNPPIKISKATAAKILTPLQGEICRVCPISWDKQWCLADVPFNQSMFVGEILILVGKRQTIGDNHPFKQLNHHVYHKWTIFAMSKITRGYTI